MMFAVMINCQVRAFDWMGGGKVEEKTKEEEPLDLAFGIGH